MCRAYFEIPKFFHVPNISWTKTESGNVSKWTGKENIFWETEVLTIRQTASAWFRQIAWYRTAKEYFRTTDLPVTACVISSTFVMMFAIFLATASCKLPKDVAIPMLFSFARPANSPVPVPALLIDFENPWKLFPRPAKRCTNHAEPLTQRNPSLRLFEAPKASFPAMFSTIADRPHHWIASAQTGSFLDLHPPHLIRSPKMRYSEPIPYQSISRDRQWWMSSVAY